MGRVLGEEVGLNEAEGRADAWKQPLEQAISVCGNARPIDWALFSACVGGEGLVLILTTACLCGWPFVRVCNGPRPLRKGGAGLVCTGGWGLGAPGVGSDFCSLY